MPSFKTKPHTVELSPSETLPTMVDFARDKATEIMHRASNQRPEEFTKLSHGVSKIEKDVKDSPFIKIKGDETANLIITRYELPKIDSSRPLAILAIKFALDKNTLFINGSGNVLLNDRLILEPNCLGETSMAVGVSEEDAKQARSIMGSLVQILHQETHH